jgi:hypothetical protein
LATLSLVECSDFGVIHGQTRARKTEEKGMDVTKLRLTATSRQKSEHLYPEQSAFFDFSLLNGGSAPAEVMAFYGNDTTPVYRIFDSTGKLMNELGIRDLERRFNADMGDPAPQPPRLMKIAAGKSREGWVDLWSYRAPLPAGHYQFAMAHRLTPGAEFTESNRGPFEVVDAEVAGVALGYGEQDHSTSLMAWLASAPGGGEGRILMRQSATLKHNSAQRSGMPIGTGFHRHAPGVGYEAHVGSDHPGKLARHRARRFHRPWHRRTVADVRSRRYVEQQADRSAGG